MTDFNINFYSFTGKFSVSEGMTWPAFQWFSFHNKFIKEVKSKCYYCNSNNKIHGIIEKGAWERDFICEGDWVLLMDDYTLRVYDQKTFEENFSPDLSPNALNDYLDRMKTLEF